MAKLSDPNEKAPQEPGPQPAAPVAPEGQKPLPQAAPDPQKDPIGYMIYLQTVGFESVHKRLNQQGELIAQMAEKVYGPQGEGVAKDGKPAGLAGLFNSDTINRFLDLAKDQFGGGGPDKIYMDIGKRVVEGATDTAIKRIIRNVGGEAAGSISHVG